MRDLQLRTITIDTARWQRAQQPTLWHALAMPPRIRVLH